MKVNVNNLINSMSVKNVNQSQLAKGAGIRQATVSEVVNGKRGLQIGTINKIAAFLECKPADLCMEARK